MQKMFPVVRVFFGAVLLCITNAVQAEFTFNFQPYEESEYDIVHDCKRPDSVPGACFTDNEAYLSDEPTPFVMENVEIDGEHYFHYVMGDPNDGFAMEVYIQGGFTAFFEPDFHLFAAPFATAENHPQNGGAGLGPLTERVPVIDPDSDEVLTDPATGKVITTDLVNGRGNPTKMVMRMVLGDANTWDGEKLDCSAAEFCTEFLKDAELTKPLISQTIHSGSVTAEFQMDMRAIAYDDIDTAAPMVNTVTFAEAIPGGFDMATDIQSSVVSGGRYTYTPGDVRDGSLGHYEYWDGGFNMENIKWETYRDPSINPDINLEPYPNEF